MSRDLANEIVKSLKEYAYKIDETYRERQICTFHWKPAHIAIDEDDTNKVVFDMVYLDDESLKGCVSVAHSIIYENKDITKDKLVFSIWERQPWGDGDNSTARFAMPYHGDSDDWYSIGSYVYSFVNEIDTLMRCYQENYG